MKVYRNTSLETVYYVAVKEGVTVTVRPGHYIKGNFDKYLDFMKKLKVVTDTDEADKAVCDYTEKE